MDWDGGPVILPFLPYIAPAVASAAAATVATYAAYKTLRDQSGWKNQQRRDREANEELDKAQLNVQNGIKENFPDLDNYDPNDGPKFRRDTKFSAAAFLGLYLLGDDSSFLRQLIILSLEAKEEKANKSEDSSEGDNGFNESTLSDSKDDNDVNTENLWTDENMELWQ